jgi:hypothetical protein
MKPSAHALKWSLIFVTAALAWMVFEKAMGWHGEHIARHPVMTNFFALVAVTVFVFALWDKRKSLGGVMTWKEGFLAGLWVSLGVALLSPLSQWLTHAVISPDYFPNVIEYAVESGKATREEAESFFNLRSYMIQSAIGGLVMGAITSAVVALFVRRKSP